MNKITQSHCALFAANLIYAANFTIAKDVMPNYIQPFGFILLRVSGALLLYWLVAAVIKNEKVDKKDFPRLFLCGLFGIAINQLLFFKGLNTTSPINAAIMMVCTPILVVIISSFLIKDKIKIVKIVGVVLGLAGAIALIVTSHASSSKIGEATFSGDMCVLINATSWAIYLVIVKPLMLKYNTLTQLNNLSDLRDKTLLIIDEQGYGDFIQFSRYIYKLLEYHPRQIVLEINKSLRNFAEIQFGNSIKIIEIGSFLKESVDFKIALLSLPYLFNTTLNSIP